MRTLRSSFGMTCVSSPALLLRDGDGCTIPAEQDTPPARCAERRHEFFTSTRLRQRSEVGMSAFFTLISGEGASPEMSVKNALIPTSDLCRKRVEVKNSWRRSAHRAGGVSCSAGMVHPSPSRNNNAGEDTHVIPKLDRSVRIRRRADGDNGWRAGGR